MLCENCSSSFKIVKIIFFDPVNWDYKVESVYQLPLGGTQSAVCYLAENLARNRHEVVLINRNQSPGISRGVRCISLSSDEIARPDPVLFSDSDILIAVNAPLAGLKVRPILRAQVPSILWVQHAANQPAVADLQDPEVRDSYDAIAFVSEWQRQQFLQNFELDPKQTYVFQNAIAPAFEHLFSKEAPILSQKAYPPVLAYTSAPFRGLDLLLEALPKIRHSLPGTRLKVFSSMKVYQMQAKEDEELFGELYRQCREKNGIEYVGSLPQEELANELRSASILAYPNTFAETFCIAAIEAMASGCWVVTSQLGALPETTAGFARLIPVGNPDTFLPTSRDRYLQQFVEETVKILQVLSEPTNAVKEFLREQVDYVNQVHSWSKRAREWERWLQEKIIESAARNSIELLDRARKALWQGDYQKAQVEFEQKIERNPNEISNYWYLGLCFLLQGQEIEAQTIWFSILMEAESQQMEAWTRDLISILASEADRQETKFNNFDLAYMIRQHLREIDPQNCENLFALLRLSLFASNTEDISMLRDFVEVLLQERYEPDLESFQKLLEAISLGIDVERIAILLDFCQQLVRDRDELEKILATTIDTFAQLEELSLHLRIVLLERSLEVTPNSVARIANLINLYQSADKYQKSVELGKYLQSIADNLLDRLAASYLIIRGLLQGGGRFHQAREFHDSHKILLQEIVLSKAPLNDSHLWNSITTTSLFSYLEDDPQNLHQFRIEVAHFWYQQVQKNTSYSNFSFIRSTTTKSLKIGYLSSCFRRHSIGHLCRWVFEFHDRDRFEVYAYSMKNRDDRIQQHITQNSQFRDVSKTTRIFEIAELIYQDEIDILVDLDSLTNSCSCGVLAFKPAPIQVTWLGFDASGIPTVDYFLADPYVLPASAEEYYGETIWRLPQTYIAVEGFEVGVPTLRRSDLNIPDRAVVYFSSQTGAKRNPDNVRAQMQILKQVPNSYFLY